MTKDACIPQVIFWNQYSCGSKLMRFIITKANIHVHNCMIVCTPVILLRLQCCPRTKEYSPAQHGVGMSGEQSWVDREGLSIY